MKRDRRHAACHRYPARSVAGGNSGILSFATGHLTWRAPPLGQDETALAIHRDWAIATIASPMLPPAVPARATFPGKNGWFAFRRYVNDGHSRAAIFTINTDATKRASERGRRAISSRRSAGAIPPTRSGP